MVHTILTSLLNAEDIKLEKKPRDSNDITKQ